MNLPIILLDLNYTLVGNSTDIKYIRPYQKKIKAEKYRKWLVELLKDYHVIIITARPDHQKQETIKSFKEKLNSWMPDEMYFQEENDRPPVAKEKLLKKYIFPKHKENNKYQAIESNPRTKIMYKKYNIPSVSVYDEEGLDLKEKHKEMFKFIKQMLEGISKETRKLPRNTDDPYSMDIQKIKDSIKSCGNFKHFEIGYMEFSNPTIQEAVEKVAGEGIKKIILVNSPGIFMRSSHSLIDVPKIIKEVQQDNPDLELIYAQPGGFLEEMADVIVKRIDHALGKPCHECQIEKNPVLEDYGIILVAHGDVPLDYLEKKDMNMAEEHIEKWSQMVRDWPHKEENDPLLYDTRILEDYIKDKGGYSNFEIGNLEFSSPTLEDALKKVLDQGAEKVIFIGGTGFMDRSSHSLVDIPEAVEKLQKKYPSVEMEYEKPDIDLVCPELSKIIVTKVEKAIINKNIRVISYD